MPENFHGCECDYSPAEYDPSAFEGDISAESHKKQAAEFMAQGKAIAIDNDAVWALWGDSQNQQFLDEVGRIKNRDPSRALGLTIPSEEFLPMVDFDKVHPDVRPLLQDTETLTGRLGAIAFIRVPGKQAEIYAREVPDCVVHYSQEQQAPILQNYDPKGKANIESLLQQANELGVRYPSASSLNSSGEDEIVEPEAAIAFARSHNLPILADLSARRKGTGSYPIVEFNEEGLTLIREGNIERQVLQDLLYEYDLIPSQTLRAAAHSPYGRNDFPLVRSLKGSELRLFLIEEFGWSDN